ncbi:zinc finger protein JACKDAW isoform X1 [Capsicum galapagoense]
MMSGDLFSIHQQQVVEVPNPNNSKANSSSSKKRRNLPGTPDPDAEVIALSPKTLMATNRFVCEICNKGFQRDQNLQLHRRGHNLPWKLKQRNKQEIVKKKVYICPEKACVHHDPSRALGDLTGIKKHFSRKHGEKKWKCEKCSKKYAVQSDWKAHTKTCGTREYKCDCGTLFSRKDSFITHRAFCDALAEESARITSVGTTTNTLNFNHHQQQQPNLPIGTSQISTTFSLDFTSMTTSNNNSLHQKPRLSHWLNQANTNLFSSNSAGLILPDHHHHMVQIPSPNMFNNTSSINAPMSSAPMSATALLQKAAQIGSTKSTTTNCNFSNTFGVMNSSSSSSPSSNNVTQIFNSNTNNNVLLNGCPDMHTQNIHFNLDNSLTRDFLGMGNEGGQPFLPQELVKFASMNSAMGLSHYTNGQ